MGDALEKRRYVRGVQRLRGVGAFAGELSSPRVLVFWVPLAGGVVGAVWTTFWPGVGIVGFTVAVLAVLAFVVSRIPPQCPACEELVWREQTSEEVFGQKVKRGLLPLRKAFLRYRQDEPVGSWPARPAWRRVVMGEEPPMLLVTTREVRYRCPECGHGSVELRRTWAEFRRPEPPPQPSRRERRKKTW